MPPFDWEARCVEAVEELRERRMQVEVRDNTIFCLKREVELLVQALRSISESGRPDAWAPLSHVIDGGHLADMADYALADHEKRIKEGG